MGSIEWIYDIIELDIDGGDDDICIEREHKILSVGEDRVRGIGV